MDEYTSKVQVWELLCPGLPDEIARARRWTRDILTGCPCADDAALIVSELGTNAVTHTASPDFRVTIRRTAQALTLAVTDRGTSTTSPHITRPEADTPHGRGLAIVTLLATDLDITRNPHGHTVTAHLPQQAAKQAPTC
jgi:anti-sigma regulatory factor (Ser/Thr protein kinase)